MRCPACQHENPAAVKFCGECGARLETLCSTCGTANPPSNKFCHQCGGGLQPSQGPKFTAPDTYTPRHLAERILTSKAALEGERKQVTVLFADLKSSMELLADRDPEEARTILDPVLDHMMEAVHHYEGTVNQVMGDGIMALFGAPLAHEDHAVRACYAALRMQEAVKRYADDARRTRGVNVQMRIGLNSGDVVVRAIGSDLHMDYTAVGQTTHLAARMEQLADAGTTLLTPATLALVEGFVDVKPLGPTPVKGLAVPIEVFELLAARAVRSRLHAAAAHGLTKFVGRTVEMAQLHEAFELARSGKGQVVAVVGEPGVGKSRLYWEFTHSHRTTECLVCEAGSVSYGKATPYVPVIELLKSYFAVERRDDARRIREKVTGKTLALDRALEPSLPALLSLLDVVLEDEVWARLDPSQRRRQTLEAVKRLLLRESQLQPLVVVFEDLHWIDGETQALLDTLIESIPTARMLLLANYRPEYQHPWGSKTYYRQLRLDALPATSADELLDSLLGSDATLPALKRLLIERTEGNPFFLEESMRTLIETGVLAGTRGHYRLARASDTLQIPATAQAILAARIDRLAPEDKRLLQAAAVIGKDFAVSVLAGIAGMTDERLHGSLARLQAAEFVYEAKLFPDVECTFKHALTHEVAYGGLLHERRRELHARIVDAMETLYAGRRGELVERLGYHALHGEAWSKAAAYLRQSGVKAAGRSSHRDAVTAFGQAIEALRHLPESREVLEAAVDVRCDLRNSLQPLGELATAFAVLKEAEPLARRLEDRRRLGWVSAYMSNYLWITGRSDAGSFAETAREIGDSVGDPALRVMANIYLAFASFTTGELRRAQGFLEDNLSKLAGDLAYERFGLNEVPAVLSRAILSTLFGARGEFRAAIACAEEGLRIAEALDHAYSRISAAWAIGMLHTDQGDPDRAVHFLEHALDLCRRGSIAYMEPFVLWSLATAYALAGRVEDGIFLMEKAVPPMEAMGFSASDMRGFSPTLSFGWGAVNLRAGRLEEARSFAETALRLAIERGARCNHAWASQLLGDVASEGSAPDLDVAVSHYQQAIALGAPLGLRPLVAHAHFGLGKARARAGKSNAAREHLASAVALYREMDMRSWLEIAARELTALA